MKRALLVAVGAFVLTFGGLQVARAMTPSHHGCSRHGHGKEHGWGHCSICNCPNFVSSPGNTDICANCGHNYGSHW